MRRLAERPAELAAEVRPREVGGPRERLDVERLAVAGVDEVLRAQEVADRMDGRDPTSIASPARPVSLLWRRRAPSQG